MASSGSSYTITFTADAESVEEFIEKVESFGKKNYNLKFNASGLSQTTRQLSNVESMARRVETAFSKVGSAVSKAGSVMQSLGNTFGGNVVGTAKTMVTAFATMGAYSAAQGTVERYDTMRMFPKMMEHLGYSAEDARAAVVKLEDAVIGLPTGLDEIVASARQLIPLTGDLNKGVNLAIAANNAFLAGGSDSQSVNYGQRQIKDLLAKGTLRSQEWDSLFTALGSGLGVIAEEMGYSSKANKGLSTVNDDLKYAESRLKSLRNTQKRLQKEGGTAKAIEKNTKAIQTWEAEYNKLLGQQDKSLGSFRNALKTNQIGALDFLEALEKVGTGEGELAKRADDYKDTISAAGRNIKNALQKLGAAGLDALDNVLVEQTGKGIPGNIREISDAIKQNLVPALEGWVDSHSGDIVNFLDRLKNYDWQGLISKIGNGLARYYDLITSFLSKVPANVIGWLSVWGSPVGRVLTAAGSGIGGLGTLAGNLIRFFGKGGKAKALDEAAEGVSALGRVGFNFKSAFQGLGLAAGITGEIALLGGVIAEYAKVMEMISNLNFGGNLKSNLKDITSVMAGSGGMAGFLTALGGLLASNPVTLAATAGGELLGAGLIGMIGEIGMVIQQYAETLSFISTMSMPKETKIKNLGEMVKTLDTEFISKVKKIPDNKVRSLENIAEMTDYAADIAAAMKRVKDVGNIGDMSKKIGKLIDGTDAILQSGYDKTDEKKSGTIKNTMANLAEATKSFADISTTLVGMENNVNALTKGGQRTVMDNLASRMDAILGSVSEAMNKMQFRSSEFERSAENVATINEGIGSIASIAQTLVDSQNNISFLVEQRHNGTYKTDLGQKITGLIGSLLPVIEKFQWKTGENQRAVDNLARFSSVAESVSTIVTSLFEARENLNNIIGKDDHGHYTANQDDFTNKVYGLFNSMKAISDLVSEMEIDTSGDAAEKVGTLSEMISGLPTIVEDLAAVQKPITDLGVEGDKWQLGDNIKAIITGLKGAFDGLSEADYSDLAENASSLQQAVSQLDSIMTSLQGVQTKIGGLGIEGGVWTAGENLGVAIRTITGMFGDQPFAVQNAGGMLTNVATQLSSIVEQLGTLATNAGNAASNLQNASKGLNQLGKAASTHKKAIGEVASAAKQLKSGVSGIGGKAMLAAVGVATLGSSAANQVSNLQNAASAASALASAINAIPTNKTVNVSANISNSLAAGGSGTGYARANIPGFASGGEVHGRGGIDNIRAWLTNGEFVMTRNAHSKFGTAFMNRVNNLDVDGALRALTIRAGAGIRSRANVTNNYTRDNHANVTFNVNRATQGFAQRKASRWARALS